NLPSSSPDCFGAICWSAWCLASWHDRTPVKSRDVPAMPRQPSCNFIRHPMTRQLRDAPPHAGPERGRLQARWIFLCEFLAVAPGAVNYIARAVEMDAVREAAGPVGTNLRKP